MLHGGSSGCGAGRGMSQRVLHEGLIRVEGLGLRVP